MTTNIINLAFWLHLKKRNIYLTMNKFEGSNSQNSIGFLDIYYISLPLKLLNNGKSAKKYIYTLYIFCKPI